MNENYWNPYFNMNNTRYNPPAPRYEIIKVNGEAGANNFRMAPNSSALLLDESAPIVWFAQTDGGGYLTITPFDITPHQQKPPVDLNNLLERVNKLEEYYVQQSNSSAAKPAKKQRQQPVVATTEPTTGTD